MSNHKWSNSEHLCSQEVHEDSISEEKFQKKARKVQKMQDSSPPKAQKTKACASLMKWCQPMNQSIQIFDKLSSQNEQKNYILWKENFGQVII